MALYDALNDDDDEVRDVAATATIKILGRAVAPLQAASQLLDHLATQFGKLPEFQHIVICRLAGVSPRLAKWPDVRAALDKTINFDDSLFAEEEQNLFVDEVRELRRWHHVAQSLSFEDKSLERLRSWAQDGLTMMGESAYRDDGPLGLASDQHYFALCARLVSSGVLVSQSHSAGTPGLQDILLAFAATGRKTDFHGSLSAMAEEK